MHILINLMKTLCMQRTCYIPKQATFLHKNFNYVDIQGFVLLSTVYFDSNTFHLLFLGIQREGLDGDILFKMNVQCLLLSAYCLATDKDFSFILQSASLSKKDHLLLCKRFSSQHNLIVQQPHVTLLQNDLTLASCPAGKTPMHIINNLQREFQIVLTN